METITQAVLGMTPEQAMVASNLISYSMQKPAASKAEENSVSVKVAHREGDDREKEIDFVPPRTTTVSMS